MTDTLTKLIPLIIYKHDNLKAEFADPRLDTRLRVIIYALAGFVYFNFGKNLTLTEIFRTQEMQDLYYKDDPLYKQKPFLSVHQIWRAADISIIYFTEPEIADMAKFLAHFEYGKIDYNTAKFHDIGLGKHLHIQVNNLGKTVIF